MKTSALSKWMPPRLLVRIFLFNVLSLLVTCFFCGTSVLGLPSPAIESSKSLQDPGQALLSPFFYEDDAMENDINAELRKPLTPPEERRLKDFHKYKMNFTAFRVAIDAELNRTSGRSPRFLSDIRKMFDFKQIVEEIETSIMSSVSCNACKGGVGLLQHYFENGKTKTEIIRAASKLCTSFKIETPRVCFGIIHLMADEVMHVINRVVMTPDEICGFVIGDVCGVPYNPFHEWRIVFPAIAKPPIRPIRPPPTNKPTHKVLHLSDTHFDPFYQEGANAECSEPLCCRETSGPPRAPDTGAGKWGDYRKCDTPARTIQSMFEHIALEHPDIDYILWTGDLPPHDIWNQTREGNLQVIRETVQQMLHYFPDKSIFPALGNHESAPVNSFPPPYVDDSNSATWLYEELDRHWRRWLPPSVSPTVRKGAFYSVLVSPNFRIISLNMNFCNNKNWWLLINSTDPAQELQWLVYELESAELAGEKVHVVGHIPPGHSDCLKVWSHNYYSIINRFEGTVSAQFFGHTHYDEFELFYDEKSRWRATNVAYIGPSVGSYYGLNPGYRIYTIEGDYKGSNKLVLDHETWVMNLDEANAKEGQPRWYKLYSAMQEYSMRSLIPQEWDILVERMTRDDELFQKYFTFYWKNSPTRGECDSDCKKRLLCDLKSGRSNDREVTCAKLKKQVEAQERTAWTNWIYSYLSFTYDYIYSFFGYFIG